MVGIEPREHKPPRFWLEFPVDEVADGTWQVWSFVSRQPKAIQMYVSVDEQRTRSLKVQCSAAVGLVVLMPRCRSSPCIIVKGFGLVAKGN